MRRHRVQQHQDARTGHRADALLKHDRMSVLVSSSGSDATCSRRNASQICVLEQVLLDVRRVERRDVRAALAHPGANGAQRLRAPRNCRRAARSGCCARDRARSDSCPRSPDTRAPAPSASVGHLELGKRRIPRSRVRPARSNTAGTDPPMKKLLRMNSMPASSSSVSRNPWRFVRLVRMACRRLVEHRLATPARQQTRRTAVSAACEADRPGRPFAGEQPATGSRRDPPTAPSAPCT